MREALDAVGISGEEIQQVTDPDFGDNVFQIQSQPAASRARSRRRRAALDDEFGIVAERLRQHQRRPDLRPAGGRTAPCKALIFSLLVICGYVALRFEPKFAVPVLIAIFHDILITAGVYSLTGKEVTQRDRRRLPDHLGLLALRHDHRLRPNTRERAADAAGGLLADRQPLDERGADAVAGDQLLTLLAVASLLVFGGATLQDFAFAMLVGIASGTYSSIFIASPVLTAWKEREPGFVRRRQRIAEVEGSVPAFADDVAAGEARRRRRRAEVEADRPRRAAEEPAGASRRPGAGRRPRERTERGQRRRRRPTTATAATPALGRAARAQRRARERAASAAPQAREEALDDGTARLVHDGNRPLALHRLPARPLLAGHRRRLRRRGDRRDRLRR